jgi:hypothetical protein
VALSDSGQQLDLPRFAKLLAGLEPLLGRKGPAGGKGA